MISHGLSVNTADGLAPEMPPTIAAYCSYQTEACIGWTNWLADDMKYK
jgi:hypothetical protein